ncbi:MAG: DUF3179 domain-containing protein [Alkalispirochaeta sp.]
MSHRGLIRGLAVIGITGMIMGMVVAGVSAGGTQEQQDAQPASEADEAPRTGESGELPPEPPVPTEELPEAFVNQTPPGRAVNEFDTDFSRATVSYAEVLSGGPPKGGIPALDRPRFETVQEASQWVADQEPVMVLESSLVRDEQSPGGDSVHVYPLQVIMWHEIVNDEIDGKPVTVTYCPLCNTGIAFSRRHEGAVLSFNTTGRLRFSNLLMFDRQTESWWQQASGDSVAGFFAGTRLQTVPVMMLPFSEVRESMPDARVLSKDTGFNRAYGSNPYRGYDSSSEPFLLRNASGLSDPGTDGPGLLDRVVSLEHDGETTSVTYSALQEELLVERTLSGERFYFLWEAGTASALDSSSIADGQDVGSGNAFYALTRDGTAVELTVEGERIVDATGSRWNAAGRAVSGPREGERLRPAVGVQHFWFSHAALVARD